MEKCDTSAHSIYNVNEPLWGRRTMFSFHIRNATLKLRKNQLLWLGLPEYLFSLGVHDSHGIPLLNYEYQQYKPCACHVLSSTFPDPAPGPASGKS